MTLFWGIYVVCGFLAFGWFACGVLAYGLEKNSWKVFYKKLYSRSGCLYVYYDKGEESLCRAALLLGPMALIAVLFIALSDKTWGLCFRMPKEFCVSKK